MDKPLIGYVITGVISLVVGVLLKHVEARPRLVFWLPHFFMFNLKQPQIQIRTDSLTVQNVGRKAAAKLQILFQARRDYFQFSTPVVYAETTTPNGNFAITVESVAPREHLNLQVLSYQTLPVLLGVRSDAGAAQPIGIELQRLYPKWLKLLAAVFIILGFGLTVYWLARLAAAAAVALDLL